MYCNGHQHHRAEEASIRTAADAPREIDPTNTAMILEIEAGRFPLAVQKQHAPQAAQASKAKDSGKGGHQSEVDTHVNT